MAFASLRRRYDDLMIWVHTKTPFFKISTDRENIAKNDFDDDSNSDSRLNPAPIAISHSLPDIQLKKESVNGDSVQDNDGGGLKKVSFLLCRHDYYFQHVM